MSLQDRIKAEQEIVAAADQFMGRLPAVSAERQLWIERQRRARRRLAMLTEDQRKQPALPKQARRFL